MPKTNGQPPRRAQARRALLPHRSVRRRAPPQRVRRAPAADVVLPRSDRVSRWPCQGGALLPGERGASCSVTNCTSRPLRRKPLTHARLLLSRPHLGHVSARSRHASITSSEEEQPGAGKQRRRQPGNCTESYASSACSELEDGNGASTRPSAHALSGAGKQPRRCGRASRQQRTSAASSSASVRLRSSRWKERKSPETSAACMCFERAWPNVCGLARSVRPTYAQHVWLRKRL